MDELTRQFYEDNEGNVEGLAKAYGFTPVDPEETLESAKAVARFGWESLPGVGTYYTVQDITEELEQENPNYLKIGMLAGTEVIGLIPGIGDAAASMIRKGADLAKPAQEVVEVTSDIPKVPRKDTDVLQADDIIKQPQMSNEEYDELFLSLDEADTPESWQQGAKALIKKGRVADPSIKTPELEDSTRLLLDNKITREEHLANVDKYKPVNPWDALPREPSDKALVFALDSGKRTDGLFVLDDATTEALGVAKSPLSVGMRFNGRLDIPAYNYHDTWIVAGTSPAVKTADNKGVTTYAKAIHYVADGDKPVKFVASPKTSEAIGTGEKNKTGYATVSGIVGDLDVDAIRAKAAQYLNDPEWTQVGFDPRRQGGFYVRAGENKHVPVREATEVIQIGPLVLARNAKLDFEYSGYNEGGMAMDEQMNAVFKSSRTGYAVGGSVDLDSVPDNTVGTDPVSGNEIPLGSLPEEVRDDIPAQLSEGEYVVPADVVRYYGVKFFEDLRAEAKFGYQDMDENGRIGGEPMDGMEIVEPEDDMMFDISELEVMEVPDEPVGAFFGGFFSKKEEKSPEEQVRERFGEVDKREKLKREAHQRAVEMANKDDNNSSSGPSIAEQINFGGDYEDVSSSSSGSKSKPKKESAASKTVRRAYTGREEPKQGVNLLENKPDAFGNLAKALGFADGGYALNPGDPGYDEQGSLGLGSEGIGLGSDIGEGSVVEMVAYINEEGRVIYILHIDGVPQNEIPAGFYRRTEEEDATEEDATEAQPAPQVVTQSDDDGGSIMPESTPIDYQNLTLDEMEDLLNDITDPKNNAIMLGVGAMMGPAGLLLKGAMMHQERTLRKEMERRLDGELTTQDRARLEGMYEQVEKKKGGLFGALTGKVADLVIGEEQGPGMDIQPPKTYTPETTAGDVTTPEVTKPEEPYVSGITEDMVAQGIQAAKDAGAKVFGTGKVSTPPKMINEEYDPDQSRVSTQNQIFEARSRAREGTQDVLDTMRERGAGRKERTAAVKEGARIENVMADQARGIKRGFKKGGLASKKKKK